MRLRGTLIDRIMTSLSKKVPEGFLTARYYPRVCLFSFNFGVPKLVRFLTKTFKRHNGGQKLSIFLENKISENCYQKCQK